MSVIADYVLVLPHNEKDAVEAVNRRLYEVDTERHQQFGKLDSDAAGGTKWLCTDIWAAAFNHLLPHLIEETIASAPWRTPEEAIVFIDAYDYTDEPGRAVTVAQLREELAQ